VEDLTWKKRHLFKY